MTKKETAITSSKTVKKILDICENAKAVDIKKYDVKKFSVLTDYYVICTGNSDPHLKSIFERLDREMKNFGVPIAVSDGSPASQWLVLDFTTVIVHIFHPDAREFYQLEKLWENGKTPENVPWNCKDSEVIDNSLSEFNRFN